jgi:hypothetical protein
MHDVLIRCIGTHIYRLHGGAVTSSNIQERGGPSVNIQDTYVPYKIYSTLAVHSIYNHGFALEQCSTSKLWGLPRYVWRFRTKIAKLPMFIRTSSGASYRLRVWYAVVPMS